MKKKAIDYLNSLIKEDTTKKEIDLIDFIKSCVKEHKEEEKTEKLDIDFFFNKLWSYYPRKINKMLAKKTFEHKIRGLTEEECKEKCNKIYALIMNRKKQWENETRDLQYIPHFSSFLNSEVSNSPKYKGR